MTSPPPRASNSTALRLAGADVLPLLHRISTAFLSDLPSGGARFTLFCDFRGRLLHRALVARTGDGAVWLLRDDAPGGGLAAFLDRLVFRDDVRIEDRGDLEVRGALVPVVTAGDLVEREGRPERVGVADGLAFEIAPGGVPGSPGAYTSFEEWERARIAAGLPRHGHEIAEAFHPFEVGRWDEVHLGKGCYTGQEVLLRIMTHGEPRRRLAKVRGAGAPPPVPSALETPPDRTGVLTSAAPTGEGWIGLAVLPAAAWAPGASVKLPDGRPLGGVEPFAAGWPRGLPPPRLGREQSA
jgi:folate-binding protein YgfZ